VFTAVGRQCVNGEGAEADPDETAGEEAQLTVQMFLNTTVIL